VAFRFAAATLSRDTLRSKPFTCYASADFRFAAKATVSTAVQRVVMCEERPQGGEKKMTVRL
jgi:hypothetical protein